MLVTIVFAVSFESPPTALAGCSAFVDCSEAACRVLIGLALGHVHIVEKGIARTQRPGQSIGHRLGQQIHRLRQESGHRGDPDLGLRLGDQRDDRIGDLLRHGRAQQLVGADD